MKHVFVDVGHLRVTVELDFGDFEGRADFLDVHRGCRMHALRLESCASEARRERHRETSRVRGAEELLGIRTLGIFESRSERIASFESSASELDLAGAFLQAS